MKIEENYVGMCCLYYAIGFIAGICLFIYVLVG